MNKTDKKIDIILSWRIGDAVSSIPMLLCLKQLNEKTSSNLKIRVFMQPYLCKLYSRLDLFNCNDMNLYNKIFSRIYPSDKAFFLETTSKNFGYYSKKTYGLTNVNKKHLTFSEELPFLELKNFAMHLPAELVSFLSKKYQMSTFSMSLFGVCLELGFTMEQIINTFELNTNSIPLHNFSNPTFEFLKDKYIVICTEAANGRKGDAFRRWDSQHYFEIAEKCHSDFGLNSVFVGTDNNVKLPDKPYFIDTRKKLNLYEVAQLMKSAEYYAGNDTGPLHIANIMQTKSIAAYFRKESLTEFNPIFHQLNTKIFNPQNTDAFYSVFKPLLEEHLNEKQPQIIAG